MIKTVLFDLGNVVLPFDVMRLAKRLMPYCSLTAQEIVDRLWNDQIADEFETGRMTNQAYFELVTSLCKFSNLTYEEFIPYFNDIFEEEKQVVNLLCSLKSNYKLGLISNTNAIHAAHIVTAYPCLSHFEKLWFSNEAGVRKPDVKIYQMALDHFMSKPDETVFIDDMSVNVHSARKIGINAIQFQNYAQLSQDLVKLGVHH